MATRESIQFDFDQARRQADHLDRIADHLDNLGKNKLNNSMQTLSQNWKGANAEAYLAKGNNLKQEITSSASDLRGIASDIRRIAQNIYNAEMEALRIAEEREYNRNH